MPSIPIHYVRDAPSPPAPADTSGVVILLAVLGSALFAIMFFWAVKRCYWDGWWYSGSYYPIAVPVPVEVTWVSNGGYDYYHNDYCWTCSGESHITVPSTDSPSSSSSLPVKPGASAGAVHLIDNGLENDETTRRKMITPNDTTNDEPRGGICTRTCVDLKQLESGPFSSTVMSQCGTETRPLQKQKQEQGQEQGQEQDARSCILM
ncbi:hypothetical protein QBC41DRAFT_288070 [Cercophora samala]|uniref:Uncharacterized protein n=1 Tax=Cercophora samala TaxID=330535 RepID=A0AA40CXF3_9PEZI|nr:hypothetical protein QBC41DRAFT_288070 [Cercophora samala]